MLSMPALVRVSQITTSPSCNNIPTQYVMESPLFLIPVAYNRSTPGKHAASVLPLCLRLIDNHRKRKPFCCSAHMRTADRRRPQAIETDGDAHIGIGRA